MFSKSRIGLILGLAGGLAALPSMVAADRDRDPDAAGVAEAIRFEKAKQAAADRQERIEARGERQENTADRMMPEPRRRDKDKGGRATTTTARRTPPRDGDRQ